MSNVPPAHKLSATENPPRRGAPAPSPDRPTSAAAQPFEHPHAIDPEAGEGSADAVGGTLSGLATPQPATTAGIPHAGRARGGRALRHPAGRPSSPLTGEQRLLLLDTWQRSGLPAGDFAARADASRN